MLDQQMVQEAGLRTWEYAAPLLLVATVVVIWAEYGWIPSALLAVGYLASASLAWRAAWNNYRKRIKP
jgi:hypothetical protein